MISADTMSLVYATLSVLTYVFVLLIGLGVLAVIVVYIADVSQTRQALRRNYPVIAHFRYLFEHLGEFFRQYFFAMDREEMPFNRAQRTWVYQSAKNIDSTRAFGSSRDIHHSGSVLFVNCPFPTLGTDAAPTAQVTIGENCRHPYTTDSLFNISGMSYGALSKPAVQALSRGAAQAGCWMNTGEGGLSPYHLEGGCDLVFQIGTAKYGVRDRDGNLSDQKLREVAAHEQVRMFELKLSQGAKPGKGGILPGDKVSEEIAQIRGIEPGQDSISPNRHPEINDVDQLLDYLVHIREVTGKPVGFKCVIGAYGWLDNLFTTINRRGHDRRAGFHHRRQRRRRHRRGADEPDGLHGPADARKPAAAGRHAAGARAARADQGDRLGQADQSGRGRLGAVRGRGFRLLGARLHVRARLHPGPAVQQEHLPDRHHHPQPETAEGSRSRR